MHRLAIVSALVASSLVFMSALAAAPARAREASEIFEAAQSGDLDRVRELVEEDPALVNASTERGSTTLLFACVGGDPEIVSLLLEAGADVDAMNESHYTALHVAAARDNVEVMALLIDAGADLEIANLEGDGALHHAASSGARRAVELLLERGANLHARNGHERTPLLLAARESGDVETALVLIRAGADVDAADVGGETPLGLATWRGFAQFVDLLLREGARMPESQTGRVELLQWAARRGLDRLAVAVLEAGIDTGNLVTSNPELICDAAGGGSVAIIELLTERGFDLGHSDKDGWTPLHWAAELDRVYAVAHLIASGATLEARTVAGETAYHVALAEGSDAAAELLVESGADTGPVAFPELRGPYMGQTPPGDVPEPFAPGIVMAHYSLHSSVAFAPDGRSAFWRISIPPRESGYGSGRMLTSRLENGRWSYPTSAGYGSADVPFFSHDGERLYFISREPVSEGAGRKQNIWHVERDGDGWTDPEPFDEVINAVPMHWQFSVDREGTFYLGSGDGRILVSRRIGDGYETPVDFRELHGTEGVAGGSPFISPEGDYLIFASQGDLHVTFRRQDGTWTDPANPGEPINSDGYDNCPLVTPDGKYLVYNTSSDAGTGPHWVAIADRLVEWRREALE